MGEKRERGVFAEVVRVGAPPPHGSSQVQDVLSGFVRKHIWQGVVVVPR